MIEMTRTVSLAEFFRIVLAEFLTEVHGEFAQVSIDALGGLKEDALLREIAYWASNNRKIHMIKSVRKMSGWGLRESKTFVDNCHNYRPMTLEESLMQGVR
jgi:ribosomal protein L7/L12